MADGSRWGRPWRLKLTKVWRGVHEELHAGSIGYATRCGKDRVGRSLNKLHHPRNLNNGINLDTISYFRFPTIKTDAFTV